MEIKKVIERSLALLRVNGIHVYELEAMPSVFAELSDDPSVMKDAEGLHLMTCNGPATVQMVKGPRGGPRPIGLSNHDMLDIRDNRARGLSQILINGVPYKLVEGVDYFDGTNLYTAQGRNSLASHVLKGNKYFRKGQSWSTYFCPSGVIERYFSATSGEHLKVTNLNDDQRFEAMFSLHRREDLLDW